MGFRMVEIDQVRRSLCGGGANRGGGRIDGGGGLILLTIREEVGCNYIYECF